MGMTTAGTPAANTSRARIGAAARRMLLALICCTALTLAGCGDDDSGTRGTSTATPAPTATPQPANLPPVLAPIGDRAAALGSDLLIHVIATDPEGQPVTLSAAGVPDNAYFLPDSGIFCLFADDAGQVGQPVDVTFTASDGTLSSSQTVRLTVVRPDAAALRALGQREALVFEPIGDQGVVAGETLTLQLAASGASPIVFRAFPEAALVPYLTVDTATGLVHVNPPAALAQRTFEITFQACTPDGRECDPIVQQHQTILLTVEPPRLGDCPDYVPPNCTELPNPPPTRIDACYKITTGGTYVFPDYVNIIENRTAKTKGGLYIVDSGKVVDLRFPSMLVEKGGTLQAGSACDPFGKQGGTLTIGIYGTDPSDEARVPSPPPGIECQTAPRAQNRCFPGTRDFQPNTYYCTQSNTDDPCASKSAPSENPKNSLLESYGVLNFDATSFGYKVLGVSYGGSLKLFGWKGALPLQSTAGAAIAAGEDEHCPVPTESALDATEMRAWANLSGSSWGRLDGLNAARTQLSLDRPMKDWQPGDQIVVGTTDWYPGHNELRTIRTISSDGRLITVCRPTADGTGPGGCPADADPADALDYPHYASIFDARTLEGAEYTQSGLNRTAVDLRATVGLLSRSIRIRSLGATATGPTSEFPTVDQCLIKTDGTKQDPSCYFGAHVMVRQGFKDAQIQGVEFRQLGQGGRIGHYPVHFHLAKNTAYAGGKVFLKDSAVWDSMNRFVTIHGTHDVTLARNVGFASIGHGYYLEDASEIDNRLCYNLGVGARGALKEFFEAQALPANWRGTPPRPSLLGRYVPPILDGVCGGPDTSACYCRTPRGGNPLACAADDPVRVPTLRLGSDAFMPVMFWAMNATNEFVGNAAVGVHGLGGCYWLLGSGVSGPSFHHHLFDGLANYNAAGGHQAPLRRFRGNTCMTAATALSAQAEIPPATRDPFSDSPYRAAGFTAIQNPYLFDRDDKAKPPAVLDRDYLRPAVTGNFMPIEPNTAGPNDAPVFNCSQQAIYGQQGDVLAPNTKSCVVSLIDRFATSYNWAQINFSSVWLRPWFYLFSNAALTDQLFGGLTFVTAGSWFQTPPGYFSIAKNGLYIGTTQTDPNTNRYAQRSGPIFPILPDTPLDAYPPCSRGDRATCNIDLDGTGYWQGGDWNPKRLISIYDGPHFADGNLFLNVGAWECTPQGCQGKQPGQCDLPNGGECGIYASTRQPAVLKNDQVDPSKMLVIDAAVGWKQNNGFYYPPAFAYRHSTFFKKVPAALQSLNNCVDSAGQLSPGSCRHNVVDRTLKYVSGDMQHLANGLQISGTRENPLPIGPIDFQTFLADLDASLTGASGVIPVGPECTCGASCTTADGHTGTCGRQDTGKPYTCQVTLPTTSLSRNAFFDAPGQSDECLSFGLQTSAYQFVTSVMAQLDGPPQAGQTIYTSVTDPDWPERPGVAIYRQWKLAGENTLAGQVCDKGVTSTERSTFMVGPNVYHAPSLTQSLPPGFGGQQGQIYYIDTSGGPVVAPSSPGAASTPLQPTNCYPGTIPFPAARFSKNKSYVIYHLFARNDAQVSYQFYVGDGVRSIDAVNGHFVRLDPHLHGTIGGGNSSFATAVTDACTPGDTSSWCGALPTPQIDANGILTVTLDEKAIAPDFNLANRADYERCMPRDLCFYDADNRRCEACASTTAEKRAAHCIRQSDFLPADIASMSTPDGTGKNPLDVVCRDWSSYASGTTSDTVGALSLVDCPKTGCLGFAFTLPDSFVGDKTYNEKGAGASRCFLRTEWIKNALVSRADGADPLCALPRPAVPTDFCDDPGSAGPPTATASLTPSGGAPPINTPTGGGGATPTNTRTGGATPSATPSGGATGTATVTPTGLVTPTPTPTATAGLTPTPTPGGGLRFTLQGEHVNNISVPLAGLGYPPNQLDLHDGQARFCTTPGKQPLLAVDVASKPIVGVFPDNTPDLAGIANIPLGPAGTYDLLIQTFVPCSAAQPTTLRMSDAITYGGG